MPEWIEPEIAEPVRKVLAMVMYGTEELGASRLVNVMTPNWVSIHCEVDGRRILIQLENINIPISTPERK